MSTANNGNTVKVHYTGTFTDGVEFDSSFQRGEPISFTLGTGQMIPGFEQGVLGMTVGETKEISLTPDQAYGPHRPEAIRSMDKNIFPSDFNFVIGGVVQGQAPTGQPMIATILEEQDSTVTLDFNHPMAGKDLNFKIELLEVSSASTASTVTGDELDTDDEEESDDTE